MTDGIETNYAEVLNALDEMQHSHAYAVRRNILRQAEQIIVSLEKENKQLKEKLNAKRPIR